MSFTLRDYQELALEAIIKAPQNDIRRPLIVIPTGGGKTVIFAMLPERKPSALPMLVIAHREELLHQAKDKILQINPNLKVGIEQAEKKAEDNSDVVVASVASLGRSNSSRISRFDDDYFNTIVVDEAHHAAAPSYKRVLEYFNPDLVLGVTATPQRGDNVRLTDVFDEVVFYVSIYDLIKAGYLCPLKGYRISTDVDLTDVSIVNGDYAQGELEQAVNIHERNDLIVKSFKKLGKDRQTIVFCSGVQHAYDLAAEFFKQGITAQALVGETVPERRERILRSFRSGETQVITNVGVLTEGFDEPSVSCIVLARPTRSSLLYTQKVGRGTRLFEGKDDCLVLDYSDTTKGKKPLGLPTLLGLPPDFDLAGNDLLEAADEFRKLEQKAPAEAARARSLGDIETSWTKIDLFASPTPSETAREYSALIWTEIAEDNFYLNIGNEKRESLHITADALGRYRVGLKNESQERELGVTETLREAFARSDAWVQKNRKENLKLLDASAHWRADPPTEKQVKYLKKFGVPITADMTKGQASEILDKFFKENPPKPKPAWVKKKIAQAKIRDF